MKNRLFEKALSIMVSGSEFLSGMSGNQCLFLLANLVHLSFLDLNVCRCFDSLCY